MFTGSEFSGSSSTTQMFIGEVEQEFLSMTDTQATFKIIDSKGLDLEFMRLFFEVGAPKGHGIVQAKYSLTPVLASINANK